MKYNLLIADDHNLFVDGLHKILKIEDEFRILYTANNGKKLVKYVDINQNEPIDLLICDMSMPEMNGMEVNNYIKKKYPEIKVLMVSMHLEGRIISQLIDAKVDGYIPKNAEISELLKAIKTILKGEKYFSQEVKNIFLDYNINSKNTQEIKLTKREIDVLKLISQEFTTLEIAEKLFISKHTVESYRKNIMAKINAKNIAGLTKYAIKKGYIEC
ncbi:response regulator [Aureivirga marina]|uniref:response regulator n=1 Tax=Aureivirga marina TaxID=1182451 RepID=UPI0018C9EDA2|nr:response regulator transcription factor [Aureivirga marina]